MVYLQIYLDGLLVTAILLVICPNLTVELWSNNYGNLMVLQPAWVHIYIRITILARQGRDMGPSYWMPGYRSRSTRPVPYRIIRFWRDTNNHIHNISHNTPLLAACPARTKECYARLTI